MTSTKYLSILESNGKAAKGKEPRLDQAQLLRLYEVMVLTRTMDERALALQRQGGIGFYVPATGQEASHIGSAFALLDSDWIFPAYRQPGIPLLRGASLDDIVNEWYGNAADIGKGRQMPVHYSLRSVNLVSISSPIGTQISQAVGAAMAAKLKKEDTVVMTYFGDGGTSSNDFHAGLNFAAVFKSPCVFVCENNQWAISVPAECQSGTCEMADKAEAYGMPGVRVDGNDVLAVYQVAKEAVDRARKGGGPTLIETLTYRMGPHSSSDDPTRYRDQKVVDEWKLKDPIARFQKYLEQKGLLDAKLDAQIKQRTKAKLEQAIARAAEIGKPPVESMFEDVYMTMTPQLKEQLDDLRSLQGPEAADEGAFPL